MTTTGEVPFFATRKGRNAHWELYNGQEVFQVRAGTFGPITGVVFQRSTPDGAIHETIALSPEDALTVGSFLLGAARFAGVRR